MLRLRESPPKFGVSIGETTVERDPEKIAGGKSALECENWAALLNLAAIKPPSWLSRLRTDWDHTSLFLHFPSYSLHCQETDFLFALCHSCPFTFALTFHLYLFSSSSGHKSNITLQPSLHHHSQSPIKAKSLPLLFRHPRAKLQYQHWHM